MAWRDRLQPGSFRGVPFFIASAEVEIGRRTVIHEYPLRDLPYAEDMGRRANVFALECFVLGPDYMTARDRLEAAIKQPGPGTLIHPYRGTLQVQITGARVTESTDEGGMARFSLSVIEAGTKTYPAASTDTSAAIETAAGAAETAVAGQFAEAFSIADAPAFVSDGAVDIFSRAGTRLSELADSVTTLPTALGTFRGAVADFTGGLSAAISAPANLAFAVLDLVNDLAALVAQPRSAVRLYAQLADFGDDLPAIVTGTPSEQRQADNQAAIVQLMQLAAVIGEARTLNTIDFDSWQEARDARAALVARVDGYLDASSDAVYSALTALQTATARGIAARGASLARIVQYTPPSTLPALVIAHRLYGTPEAADDIVRRNNIPHPGFVPGREPIEVLTDA